VLPIKHFALRLGGSGGLDHVSMVGC
jgi:hypothetical protein